MTRCKECQRPISRDEVGLTRKLINRGLTEFYCFECLGKIYRLDMKTMKDMVESFRAAGCTLFR